MWAWAWECACARAWACAWAWAWAWAVDGHRAGFEARVEALRRVLAQHGERVVDLVRRERRHARGQPAEDHPQWEARALLSFGVRQPDLDRVHVGVGVVVPARARARVTGKGGLGRAFAFGLGVVSGIA